jgi:hypothetical protein
MLSVNYAECRTQAHYAVCRCGKCSYAKCRGAVVEHSTHHPEGEGSNPTTAISTENNE